MKTNAVEVAGHGEADELATDIAILVRLSTVHEAQTRLARERQAPELSSADPSQRMEALAKEEAAAAERARRLAGGLSPDARRIYASLWTASRLPFAVGLTGDCCSGCNMRLPSGVLGEMRRVRRLHRCPSCKRVVSPPGP